MKITQAANARAYLRLWERHRTTLLKLRQRRPCPLCGEEAFAHRFESQCGYEYGECQKCDMVYCPEVISFAAWQDIYARNEDYAGFMRDNMVARVSQKTATDPSNVDRFSGYFKQLRSFSNRDTLAGLRLLDIGTFDGDALLVARDTFGIRPFGIEGRRPIAEFAASHRKLQVEAGISDTMDPAIFGGGFDLITAFESLEHTVDPLESLRRFRAALTSGGLLMITVPNADNFEFQQLQELSPSVSGGTTGPGHINFFGRATLHSALQRAGFAVVSTFTQYASSLTHIAGKLLGQPQSIRNYATEINGGPAELAVSAETYNLLALLTTAFYEWETRELKGPILGVIAR